MLKKWLSALLSASMLMTATGLPVLATEREIEVEEMEDFEPIIEEMDDDKTKEIEAKIVFPKGGKIVEQGEVGTAHWTLDSNGLLTIGKGEGAHASYPSYAHYPWENFKAQIFYIDGTAPFIYNDSSLTSYFSGFYNLKAADFSGWDISNVTHGMSQLFYECKSLTDLNISNWDTSNVTQSMSQLFYGCKSLTNLNISNWDTSNVTDMRSVFCGCSSLTDLNLSNWNTSNVTDMAQLFRKCQSLTNLNISNWNTSNVTDMSSMFWDSQSLTNFNVSNWNTSNVTDMSYMFKNCKSLTNLNISNWNTSNVTNMYDIFSGCNLYKLIYIYPQSQLISYLSPWALWYQNGEGPYELEDLPLLTKGEKVILIREDHADEIDDNDQLDSIDEHIYSLIPSVNSIEIDNFNIFNLEIEVLKDGEPLSVVSFPSLQPDSEEISYGSLRVEVDDSENLQIKKDVKEDENKFVISCTPIRTSQGYLTIKVEKFNLQLDIPYNIVQPIHDYDLKILDSSDENELTSIEIDLDDLDQWEDGSFSNSFMFLAYLHKDGEIISLEEEGLTEDSIQIESSTPADFIFKQLTINENNFLVNFCPVSPAKGTISIKINKINLEKTIPYSIKSKIQRTFYTVPNFDPSLDTFSFKNTKNSFYRTDKDKFPIGMDQKQLVSLAQAYGFHNSDIEKFKKKNKGNWNGTCAGMSIATLESYEGNFPLTLSGNTLSDLSSPLPVDNLSLFNHLTFRHLVQFSESNESVKPGTVEELINNLKNNRLIKIGYNFCSWMSSQSHAVLAYRLEERKDNSFFEDTDSMNTPQQYKYKVYLIDPNYPIKNSLLQSYILISEDLKSALLCHGDGVSWGWRKI